MLEPVSSPKVESIGFKTAERALNNSNFCSFEEVTLAKSLCVLFNENKDSFVVITTP